MSPDAALSSRNCHLVRAGERAGEKGQADGGTGGERVACFDTCGKGNAFLFSGLGGGAGSGVVATEAGFD